MENSINVIDAAIESNELNLKEVMDSVSNTITHWIVDRASTRFVIRKIGYNGFTVAFTYLKSVGEWSVLGYDKTPDSITFLIDNFGVARVFHYTELCMKLSTTHQTRQLCG